MSTRAHLLSAAPPTALYCVLSPVFDRRGPIPAPRLLWHYEDLARIAGNRSGVPYSDGLFIPQLIVASADADVERQLNDAAWSFTSLQGHGERFARLRASLVTRLDADEYLGRR